MTSPYLSPSEVSVLLRICLKQTYKLLNKGEIPGSFKLGGVWMIDKQQMLDGFTEKAQKPPKAKAVQSRHGLG